jgi:hypothetical protein
MPGPKQSIFVSLAGGISTDIDDHLLVAGPAGKALDVVNMNAYETGNLRKRFGHMLRTSQLGAGPTMPASWQLGQHKGASVNLSVVPGQFAADSAFSYSPIQTRWEGMAGSLVGPPTTQSRRGPLQVSLRKLTQQGARPAITSGGGYTFVLYSQAVTQSGTIALDVFDGTTLHPVTSYQLATPAGVAVQNYDITFCNGYAVAVLTGTGGRVAFYAINATTFVSTTATLISPVPGARTPDCRPEREACRLGP